MARTPRAPDVEATRGLRLLVDALNKRCSICGAPTEMACSDCAIDYGRGSPVCTSSKCRDEHERRLRAATLARDTVFGELEKFSK